MGLGILFVGEVDIVGGYYFNVIFLGIFDQMFVYLGLTHEDFAVAIHLVGLVTLQFEVIVIAKHLLVPAYSLFGFVKFLIHDKLRYFAAEACRADYQTLVMACQVFAVGTRLVVEAFGPGSAHQFHQVVVALIVLGEHDEVITVVALVFLVEHTFACHIHLTPQDGFEFLFVAFAGVFLLDIVEKFLDTEHVTMVG